MPKRTTKPTAKYREQQFRKRSAAQPELLPAITDELAAAVESNTAPAPTLPTPRPPVQRRATMPTTTNPASRFVRGRVAQQTHEMSIDEEMAHIRGDLRRMIVLSAAALLILLLFAFVLA